MNLWIPVSWNWSPGPGICSLFGMSISGLSIYLIVHPPILPPGWSSFPTRNSETLSGTGGWSYRDPVMLFKVDLCKLRLYLMSFSTKCLSSDKYVSNGVGLLPEIKSWGMNGSSSRRDQQNTVRRKVSLTQALFPEQRWEQPLPRVVPDLVICSLTLPPVHATTNWAA